MTEPLPLSATRLPYLDSAEIFELVADEPWSMFFDSGLEGEGRHRGSRYDVLAIRPQATLVFDGETTKYTAGDTDRTLYGDPMSILQAAIPECEDNNISAYVPGAFGYFSYDLARQYEMLQSIAEDHEQLPPMAMGIYYVILVIDHKRRKSSLIRMGDRPEVLEIEAHWMKLVLDAQDLLVQRELQRIEADALSSESKQLTSDLAGVNLTETLTWNQYCMAFDTVRDYTEAGDCYQVNLTKQFAAEVEDHAWAAYRQLRISSPAPYGCFMNLPFAQILSNSPESFIQCRGGKVTTSPIKGTRPRVHDDSAADEAAAKSLYNSAKDRAENLMIVDLMRNDLSRSCELGSVKVPRLFELHSFANVHHLISTVIGILREDLHALDLLRRAFPGGSVTGAPKIRAMEIIEELEPQRRGLYCGSIGYIGADGNLETNIAIRTIVIKDGVARFSAGGGLVVDSDVEDEYQELNDKASMMRSAVIGASAGES